LSTEYNTSTFFVKSHQRPKVMKEYEIVDVEKSVALIKIKLHKSE